MMDLHEACAQAHQPGWREGMAEALAVAEQVCREHQKSAAAITGRGIAAAAVETHERASAATAAEIADILRERIGGAG